MHNARQLFLHQNWHPYPAMPAAMPGSTFVCGRISSIQGDRLQLANGASVVCTSVTRLLPAKSVVSGSSITEILQVGDLVAVQGPEVWLLAPQLQEFALALRAPARSQLQEFSEFLQKIRTYFKALGFLEAMTPGLVDCPGTEPYLDAFSTEFVMGRHRRTQFLPTSPELHLKKMLSLGYGPLFEIKNCFRNGEISAHHEPEFFMLEWYRPYTDLAQIAQDVEYLLRSISGISDLSLQKFSMSELFEKFFHYSLTPSTSRQDLVSLAEKKGIRTQGSDSIDDVFHRLFMEGIEPFLPDEPTLVNDYPPFLAAYARLNEAGWADRFEIYWKGIELANAFHEINDPVLQKARMLQDLAKKEESGRSSVPLDKEFFEALEAGMPPSAGIALGLDRLFIVIKEMEKIQDFKVFSYGRFL
jgi:lysyl-tRNA synthetase class 2